jgi:hypothetical protein
VPVPDEGEGGLLAGGDGDGVFGRMPAWDEDEGGLLAGGDGDGVFGRMPARDEDEGGPGRRMNDGPTVSDDCIG